ncbi:HET-domain-containing protein [Xylaria acuta]|nr:HET-domain-containing protein [Xylaria acuta]
MRLIDVQTFELKEFFHNVPPYAILSHTWGHEEVSFQEYVAATGPDAKHHVHITRKAGFPKIVGACERARVDKLQYLWCDTNCIDKTSSAELSEAINSMYAWYRDSAVCYAYLADVDGSPGAFEKSRWFTRGWTLQELLAPKNVIFFDGRWRIFGDRSRLSQIICSFTSIHIGALRDRGTIPKYSIAQRMSWAADRQTSRHEDIAYCLLGIFGVNMSLLYGEGPRAFIRLQEEIIKISDDQSILAWVSAEGSSRRWTTALASSPSRFRLCGSIVRHRDIERENYHNSNHGIALKLQLVQTYKLDIVLAGLNCARELRRSDGSESHEGHTPMRRLFQVWIPLRLIGSNRYLRDHHPASLIFLQQSYPVHRGLVVAKTFISTDERDCISIRLRGFGLIQPVSGISPLSTGIFVEIASADVIPPRRFFKDAYPLKNLSFVALKTRRRSAISHLMISCGNYSVFLSVLWDKDVKPLAWVHSSILDHDRVLSNQMSTQKHWACLFGGDAHSDLAGCCSTMKGLYTIHERLQQLGCTAVKGKDHEMKAPHVTAQCRPLYNDQNQPEVVFECVFREPTELKG